MSSIGLILLAAGASTRMGEPKQLLTINGQTLFRRAAETAIESQCSPVIAVVGANVNSVLCEARGLDLTCVENPWWQQGIGSSIQTGVKALLSAPHRDVEGVVVMLCDQPLVTSSQIDNLVQASRINRCSIIASAYCSTLGAPALFPRSMFGELMECDEASGAKRIIDRNVERTVAVPFPAGKFDVDTKEDYKHLLSIVGTQPQVHKI